MWNVGSRGLRRAGERDKNRRSKNENQHLSQLAEDARS